MLALVAAVMITGVVMMMPLSLLLLSLLLLLVVVLVGPPLWRALLLTEAEETGVANVRMGWTSLIRGSFTFESCVELVWELVVLMLRWLLLVSLLTLLLSMLLVEADMATQNVSARLAPWPMWITRGAKEGVGLAVLVLVLVVAAEDC
jgi:hypothetical protein